MKLRAWFVMSALLTVCSLTVVAADSAHTGALSVPANRIVGLWTTQATISPCGSGLPPGTGVNTLLFHAGGTVQENTMYPPGGLPDVYGVPGLNQRNNGLGTWSYNPATGWYGGTLRFDWWVDNVYHGYMIIERQIRLSRDGRHASGPVRATRYALDGTIIVDFCGTTSMDRL